MRAGLFRETAARLRAEWQLKVGLSVAINLVFWSGYAVLARHPVGVPWVPPRLWLDRAVPFSPVWAWVYLSQFLVTAGLPWLLVTRAGIWRYTAGFAAVSAVSFAIFAAFPAASPRPRDLAGDGPMALVLAYDGPLNAFPSLHAAFLVYMAGLARRMFPRMPRSLAALGLLWGAAILYATLATKQHYVVDLVAGALIGWVGDWIAWRGAELPAAATSHARSRVAAIAPRR